ncbi:MAG: TlpA disulfide reductase family protein [Granulicella sp.]
MKKAHSAKALRRTPLLPLLLTLFAVPSIAARSEVAQMAAKSPGISHQAPNFSRLDLHHKKIELASYRGKVVLLNFWATWCAPCLLEIPQFSAWQKEFGSDKFQVIGVSMDDASPEVVQMVSKLKIAYPVLMGDEHLGTEYGGILGLPVTFLIDRDGKIAARYGTPDLAQLKSDIQHLLQSK